ncbi:hypothetical protein ACJ73_00077 [Blastomyces percursus]|uniref:Transcription factor domain-containing protein n=1 Tax=Blastomyces percursus TaxID=1658174 RepID=A0A1J9QJ79_9EURO|nr:hypothetical protein ACJ73_00077 [Blastomyces percursus]
MARTLSIFQPITLDTTASKPPSQPPDSFLNIPNRNGSSGQPPPLIPIHAATRAPAPAPPLALAPVADPNLEELELMMNWYNTDIHPFSTNLEYNAVWRKAFQRESLTHPFLMHGILALSALELGRRQGCNAANVNQRPYTAIALGHHSRTVALSQPGLKIISEENSKAYVSTLNSSYHLCIRDSTTSLGSEEQLPAY